ncbi:MAG: ATP-grasp domain-containing protein, partial [Bdellovibrionales bacterium]|nr:ATP-grasp domain-containing protein [Bdellovibrionales bacterium]
MSTSPSHSGSRLGILGGGQLAGMLLPVARAMGVRTVVLDEPGCPAESLCDEFIAGSPTDPHAVARLGERADVVTFEIEAVDAGALEALERAGKQVRPGSAVIRVVQDKGLQKEFFARHGFPTAPFVLLPSPSEAARLGRFPAMIKLRRGGYDGRGVYSVKGFDDLKAVPDRPVVLEDRVEIARELSLIVARSVKGELRVFPAVEMVFDSRRNQLDYLVSPSAAVAATLDRARALAELVAERLGVVGLLAVELFETRGGELLVNEVSPRLHNSGHHT